jgi:hypothetical protein
VLRGATISVEDTGTYVAMPTTATTPVMMEIAQEYVIESDQDSGDLHEKDTV